MFKKKQKKKLFKLGSRSTSPLPPSLTKERSIRAEKLKDTKDRPPFYVRGQIADSKNEYWCSIVLDEIEEQTGWTWDYQVSVFGGRSRAGGNVIDFLIDTPGMKTMLDPKGRYWHTGRNEDQSEMRNVARRKKWRLIEWFTDETPTLDATRKFLRDELNL